MNPQQGLVVIHGHFYQPPRENPWTGQVDAEPSAAPDHDWNARVTRESYLPLMSVAIDDDGKPSEIPVYEYLSFDFGATLLDWMEREAPEIHDAVLRADRASVQRLGYGRGSRVARRPCRGRHRVHRPCATSGVEGAGGRVARQRRVEQRPVDRR